MDKRTKKLLVPLAGLLAVGLAWLVADLATDAEEAREPAASPSDEVAAPCSLSPGARLAFRVEHRARVRIDPTALLGAEGPPQGGPVEDVETLQGRMLLHAGERMATAEPATWRVHGIFRDVQLAGDSPEARRLAEQLEAEPVELHVDERCRLTGLVTSETMAASAQRRWQALMMAAEFVGPPSPERREWVVTQSDGTGEYDGVYRRTDEGAYTRRRRDYRYEASPDRPTLEGRILSSRGHARPADDGWYEEIAVEEELELRTPTGDLFNRTSSELRIERRPVEAADPFWSSEHALHARTSWEPGELAPTRPRPLAPDTAGASAFSTLSGLLEALAARVEGGDRRAALRLLVGWIEGDGARATELVDAVAAGRVERELRPLLFLALERSGGEAARRALLEATERNDLGTPDRVRAIAALADFRGETGPVLEGLRRLREQGATELERDAALLAMGRLATNEHLEPDLASEIERDLRATLTDAREPSMQRRALSAIGNTRDPALADAVRPSMDASDPRVRGAAWETMRKIGSGPGATETLRALREEPDERTRAIIARGLADAPGATSAEAMREAAELLGTRELSPSVQQALVELLGPQADDFEPAREALLSLFERASSEQVLRAIGRYIPAEDLGG